jgi:hypothetical protein
MTAPTSTAGVRRTRRSSGPTKAQLAERLDHANNNLELARESITELQLAMEDIGWSRLIAAGEREFTRDGLRQITAICELFSIKNPLVKRGLILRQAYIHGLGVEITARANGKRHDGEQDVNAVLQAFLDDPGNRRALFGAEAKQRVERALGTGGNLFLSLWTKPTTGRVQVRLLPWDEITDVVTNPEDASEPWFYRREWQEQTLDPATGSTSSTPRRTLYPAIDYRPATQPKTLGDFQVRWDAPVRHVKVNDLDRWKFGVPDSYAAIDWARAYKEFLEDWARLVKSLSRYAWRTTAAGSKQAKQIRSAMAATSRVIDPATGETRVGDAAITETGRTLEAIPKTGATIDSESGRPLAMMVAAALGLPVTMLLADPGQTGARATAETLDQPTQLEMGGRRQIWSDVYRDVAEYVIRESVRAGQGALKGKVRLVDDHEVVELDGDTESTIDIDWPSYDNVDLAGLVEAVVAANGTGTVPPEIIVRLLLTALGVSHVDEVVDALTDEDGTFRWPETAPLGLGSTDPGSMRPDANPGDSGTADEPAGGNDT